LEKRLKAALDREAADHGQRRKHKNRLKAVLEQQRVLGWEQP